MYKGLIKKSRTLDMAAMVAALGVLEMNLPLVRESLGNYYGWVFIGIAVAAAVLRLKTTGPVGQK